jgi:hypothetical protein
VTLALFCFASTERIQVGLNVNYLRPDGQCWRTPIAPRLNQQDRTGHEAAPQMAGQVTSGSTPVGSKGIGDRFGRIYDQSFASGGERSDFHCYISNLFLMKRNLSLENDTRSASHRTWTRSAILPWQLRRPRGLQGARGSNVRDSCAAPSSSRPNVVGHVGASAPCAAATQ